MTHRIYFIPVADVYRPYLATLARKGRSAEELERVTCWLSEALC